MKHILIILLSAIMLGACGQVETDNNSSSEMLEMVQAEIDAPESVQPGVEAMITVTVTQGNDLVEDADEVMFEVWKENAKEASEMIEAENKGDGTYVLHTSFNEVGTYTIQSHVTARSMHTMPTVSVTVGNPMEDSSKSIDSEETEHHMDAEHSEQHHDGSLSIQLETTDGVQAHKEQSLQVAVNKNGEALVGATVSLQIKHSSQSDDAWVELKESNDGKYAGPVTFNYSGLYHVTVHVKKEELHEHKEIEVTVE